MAWKQSRRNQLANIRGFAFQFFEEFWPYTHLEMKAKVSFGSSPKLNFLKQYNFFRRGNPNNKTLIDYQNARMWSLTFFWPTLR